MGCCMWENVGSTPGRIMYFKETAFAVSWRAIFSDIFNE